LEGRTDADVEYFLFRGRFLFVLIEARIFANQRQWTSLLRFWLLLNIGCRHRRGRRSSRGRSRSRGRAVNNNMSSPILGALLGVILGISWRSIIATASRFQSNIRRKSSVDRNSFNSSCVFGNRGSFGYGSGWDSGTGRGLESVSLITSDEV
jgi:hypothetical protein